MWKKIKYNLAKLVIKFFGNVQFFPYPFFCLLFGDTHYKVKGDEEREVLKKLQKGDILLTRFDRYVTSWFIPGYYTHVVLYIGDQQVIHAITKGVVHEDILSVLRCDHVCVLRPKNVSSEEIDVAVNYAKGLEGRQYDFIFDSVDDENLYCSELVRNSYIGLFDSLGINGAIAPDEYAQNEHLEIIHESKRYRRDG